MKKFHIILSLAIISLGTFGVSRAGGTEASIPEELEAVGRKYLRRVDGHHFPEHYNMMHDAVQHNDQDRANTILDSMNALQATMVKEKIREIGIKAGFCGCVAIVLMYVLPWLLKAQ